MCVSSPNISRGGAQNRTPFQLATNGRHAKLNAPFGSTNKNLSHFHSEDEQEKNVSYVIVVMTEEQIRERSQPNQLLQKKKQIELCYCFYSAII